MGRPFLRAASALVFPLAGFSVIVLLYSAIESSGLV